MPRRDGETFLLGTAMALRGVRKGAGVYAASRARLQAPLLSRLWRDPRVGHLQQRRDQRLIGLLVPDEGRTLPAPITGDRLDQARMRLGQVALVLWVELHHHPWLVLMDRAEDLPPRPE